MDKALTAHKISHLKHRELAFRPYPAFLSKEEGLPSCVPPARLRPFPLEQFEWRWRSSDLRRGAVTDACNELSLAIREASHPNCTIGRRGQSEWRTDQK